MTTGFENCRVRFAPSPTGFLHVGGARTALFNWFLAKRYGGKFILRVEDTDTERNRPEFEEEIYRSMRWLGMIPDEGPFRQSERFDRYRAYVNDLLNAGRAYKCYCTAEEVDAMRKKAELEGKKPMYDRRCRELKEAKSGPFVVRFKTPLSGEVLIEDLIKGPVKFPLTEIDDFIILRTNNTPIYNLTVVVDDVDMKITHVVRAEEHLNNAPKQALLMEALGFKAPAYAHVPLILAPDKTKLSKRHGAVAVSQYKEQGILSDAMVSYLMRLGWSHGNQEYFTREELGNFFDLSHCGKSGSVFDVKKLESTNAHFIKSKSLEELLDLVKSDLGVDLKFLLSDAAKKKFLEMMKERAVKLTEFVSGTEFLVKKPQVSAENQALVSAAKPEWIAAFKSKIELLPAFEAAAISEAFKQSVAELGIKMPELGKPLRVLLTGVPNSPDLGIVCAALGQKETLLRLTF